MHTERDEVELLLPWYESGKLDAADEARVEEFLAKDADLAARLVLIREERQTTISLNEAAGAPGPGALDRLMDKISEEEGVAPHAQIRSSSGWFARLLGVSGSPALSWAAAAAAILIVVQAATISLLLTSNGQPGSPYEVATGGVAGEVKGTFAFVQFADEAKASAIAEFLADLDVSVVDGPKPGGVFKVRVSDTRLSDEALTESLKKLLANQMLILTAVPAE